MSLQKQFLKKQRSQKLNIHCVGDAMIDEYYEVSVKRISPEFPMPIMHSEEEKPVRKPGGVANVAHQYRHLNVNARLISFSDTEATSVFREHGLGFSPCTTSAASIPRKKRFLDDGIQVKRWDIEQESCGIENTDSARAEALEFTSDLGAPDVAILSDYDKGFFDPERAKLWVERYKDCITVVDPKHAPANQWRGCTVVKPNMKEALSVSGLSDIRDACFWWGNECDSHVIITRGGNGFIGYDNNKDEVFEYSPEDCCERPDSVIGAGDCFSAFLAQALGLGFNLQESARIAFDAGAIYVRNNMNRPIVPAELSADKIVDPADLANRDFKLVFTNGCFDLIHRGHLKTLGFSKSKGDKLVVAINSDNSVRRLKGEDRPVKLLVEREAVMASFDMVDFVVSFEEDTPYEAIKACKPDVLVKGGDYDVENIVGADIVPEVLTCPLEEGLSTTGLLSRGIGITGT